MKLLKIIKLKKNFRIILQMLYPLIMIIENFKQSKKK